MRWIQWRNNVHLICYVSCDRKSIGSLEASCDNMLTCMGMQDCLYELLYPRNIIFWNLVPKMKYVIYRYGVSWESDWFQSITLKLFRFKVARIHLDSCKELCENLWILLHLICVYYIFFYENQLRFSQLYWRESLREWILGFSSE